MRLKEEVMEMLRQGDSEGLEHMVVETPAAVRFLQGRLWDSDPEIQQRAAVALGAAAAVHPPQRAPSEAASFPARSGLE